MDDLEDRSRIAEREKMVQEQLIARGITNSRVLAAFRKIPRHHFVPEKYASQAYEDHPICLGQGQTISQPYMVAAMLELLELKGHERVLEVGTGSGYQACLLAHLAREVYTVERLEGLKEEAEKRLAEMECRNAYFKVGDGSKGWREYAPYEAIIVSAAAAHLPQTLVDELAEKGRLALPLSQGVSQILTRVTKISGSVMEERFFRCVFVPLIEE